MTSVNVGNFKGMVNVYEQAVKERNQKEFFDKIREM